MPTYKSPYTSYCIGFILSAALTLTAYYFVHTHIASGHTIYTHPFLTAVVLIAAVLQFIVQITFFLHIFKGADRRANIAIFISTLSIVIILVVGSIWIMNNLNYNMTPTQINQYMYDQG